VAKVTRLAEDMLNISATAGIGGAASGMKLDAGFQFEPTESATAVLESPYRWWHADFVVYADKDVPADSVALAGYYVAWCQYNDDNWVALANTGMDIPAGEEIRLVDGMGGGAITVNYKEICEHGNDGIGFRCGLAALNPSLEGTTVTVELRLYEVENDDSDTGSHNVETGKYITLSTYSYTFGEYTDIIYDASTMGGLYEYLPTLQEGDVLILPAGTYTTSGTFTIPSGVTIKGAIDGDVIIRQISSAQDNIFNCEGDVVIQNITFESNRKGYAVCDNTKNHDTDGDITISNCKFTGIATEKNYAVYKNLNGNLTINNCEFNNYNNAICGVNNGNGSTTVITGCTFININGEAIGYVASSMPAEFETEVIANNTGLTAANVIGY